MPSKLEKFADVDRFSNCFALFYQRLSEGFPLKGKWQEEYFRNNNPLVLELGCGKGEYTLGLAVQHPEKNYIGVDIKGNRIWTGAKHALENGIRNVAFLRSRIDFIENCFGTGEVSEIWITFPDPQPQSPRARKRLTNPLFLERYRKFLKPNAIIHLKTDNTGLYEYTLEVLRDNGHPIHWHTNDLYNNCPADRSELVTIKTYYEKLFTSKGEDIKYISFSLAPSQG